MDPFGAQPRKATASQTWCGSSDKPTGQTSRSGLQLRAAFDTYCLVRHHVGSQSGDFLSSESGLS